MSLIFQAWFADSLEEWEDGWCYELEHPSWLNDWLSVDEYQPFTFPYEGEKDVTS